MGKLYVGVSGTARQVKKLYVGVNGVARKVKKLYVGVNGIARKVFSSFFPEYYGSNTTGEVSAITSNQSGFASTSIGNYALFGGGRTSSSSCSSRYYAYSNNLVCTYGSLNGTATSITATTLNNAYAIFSCGDTAASSSKTTYGNTWTCLDPSLTKISISAPYSSGSVRMCSCSNNNYAIFGCGEWYTTSNNGRMLTYDNSLTTTNNIFLSTYRYNACANSLNGYCVFAGGRYSGSCCDIVTIFDGSLTMSDLSLILPRYMYGFCNIDDKILVLYSGRSNINTSTTTVEYINRSFTVSNASSSVLGSYDITGHNAKEYGICTSNGSSNPNTVILDASVTQTIGHQLSYTGGYNYAGAIAGNYLVLVLSYYSTKATDVWKISE